MTIQRTAEIIPFGTLEDRALHFFRSKSFLDLTRKSMSLVDETAKYLHWQGQVDERSMSRDAHVLYKNESMRLTIRLDAMMKWLLVHRAAVENNEPFPKARRENGVKPAALASYVILEKLDALPKQFTELIGKSLELAQRIKEVEKRYFPEHTDAR